jgi:hypothetical protein
MKTARFAACLLVAMTFLSLCGSVRAQLTVTNNLVLWLKADALALSDGAAVSVWDDSSVSNNDATQGSAANQPAFQANEINGLPVVRFTRTFTDGSLDDFLATTYTSLPSGLTYVAVTRGTILAVGKGYTGNAALNIIGDSTGNVWNGFGQTSGRAEFNAYENTVGWESNLGTTTLNDGIARSMIASFSPSDNTPRVFVNGLLEASGSTTYAGSFMGFNSISRGYVSGTPPFQGDGFDGDIAEILVYNTALASTDRQLVHEYLVSKYALPEPSVAALAVLGLLGFLKLCRRAR